MTFSGFNSSMNFWSIEIFVAEIIVPINFKQLIKRILKPYKDIQFKCSK